MPAQDKSLAVAPDAPPGTGTGVSSSGTATTGTGVEEAPLPLHLQEQDGRLVPYFKWTPEEFDRLYQLSQGLRTQDQTPKYSLQSLSATGVAVGGYAELTIVLDIRVGQDNGVAIPLRLGEAIFRGDVRSEGPDECLLHVAEDGKGYVLRLRGSPQTPHRVTLDVLVPIVQVGDESRLRISTPRATQSSLKLRVPFTGAVGQVAGKASLQAVPTADGAATELTVVGLDPDLQLVWRKPGTRGEQQAAVLESEGETLVRMSDRTVRSETTLTVRGTGRLESFTIRLPPGTVPTLVNGDDYTLAAGASPDLVQVHVEDDTADSVTIRLSTSRPRDSTETSWVELAGFEVLEAARHWGHIAVSVPREWQVLWGPRRNVRQVDQWPESLRQSDVVAAFEYFSQPCSLTARVVPRQVRLTVEPEYVLLVAEDQVKLEMKLRYGIRGNDESALSVQLAGWAFDNIQPENLVAVDGAAVDSAGALVIPLLQPARGNLEIIVTAHRPIEPGTARLSLALPQPQAGTLGPATLVVAAAENVELTPVSTAMRGLSRQDVPPAVKLPEGMQPPLVYRGETARAMFVAEMAIRERSLSVDVASEIHLTPRQEEVRQRLSYHVGYQRVDELLLDVPAAVAKDLRVFWGDRQLSLAEVRRQNLEPASPALMRALLPSAVIGPLELALRYPIHPPQPKLGEIVATPVPLVMPRDGDLLSNRLLVRSPAGIKVQANGGVWKPAEPSGTGLPDQNQLELSATERTAAVTLEVAMENPQALGSTVVERAWIQTWHGTRWRQDRAVFNLTTDQQSLELAVPSGVEMKDVKVILDDQPVEPKAVGINRLRIELSGISRLTSRRLETWYYFSHAQPAAGRLRVELPHLEPHVWVRKTYWQLILPPNEHAVIFPSGFTPEYRWGWNGAFWGRISLLDQKALEIWSGAPQLSPVPDATSRYLFSGMGAVTAGELRTASRSVIVLGASGAALVAGLLLIYVPAVRNPAALLVASIGLATAALIYPGPTLLAGEAAVLGLALAIVAAMLRRSMGRHRRPIVLPEVTSSILERASSPKSPQTAPVGNQLSTEVLPAELPVSTSDVR